MVKRITHSLAFLVTLLILIVGGAVILTAGGPKHISWLKPTIERALQVKGSPYKVSIGDVVIDWRSLNRFGAIRLTRVEWQSLDGQVFATLPEMDATLRLPNLLIGDVSLGSVTVYNPKLFLVRDEQGEIKLGLQEDSAILTIQQLLAPMMAEDEQAEEDDDSAASIRLPFKRFAIENAYMQMKDMKSGSKLISSPFSLRVGRDDDGIYGAMSMPFVRKDTSKNATTHYVAGTAQWSRETKESIASLSFEQMPADMICMFTSCGPVSDVKGKVSGSIKLGFNKKHVLENADITMNTARTILTMPEWFPKPLDIREGLISARLSKNAKQWLVHELNLKLPDTVIKASGNGMKHADGWAVQVTAGLTSLPMNALYKYWPMMLSPESRTWVTTHITEGIARKATLQISLQPQDFSAEFYPDHAIRSEIDAENLTVDYLKGFPPATGVNGHVVFTGETMEASTTTGKVLTGTTIAGSRIRVKNLNAPSTPMEAELKVSAPARDVASLLALKHFVFEDALKLNPETIQGTVDGQLALKFDAFSGNPDGEVNFDKVDYDINGLLTGISQPDLWGKLNLQALDGTMRASNDAFAFNGTSKIDDTKLTLDVEQEESGPMVVGVKGTLGYKDFVGVGLPKMREIKGGNAKIDAQLEVGADDAIVKRAAIDVTDLELDIPPITWKKAKGVKGTLNVKQLDKHTYAPHAYGFDIRSDDLRAKGEVATKDDEVVYVSVPRLQTNLNDFRVKYEVKPSGKEVRLSGKRLDASGSYDEEENTLLQDFPALDLEVDLDEFVLSQTGPTKRVKGYLRCDKQRCTSAEFNGTAGKSDFSATIGTVNGQRQLELKAGDAGDFLRALDITDRVYNGALNLKGTYDDTQNPAPFNGRFIVEKFNLKNSQVLGKILSVGSFSGLANTLTGEGIYFDKLAATMIALGGKVTVKDGKASGSSVGLTIEGALDTATTVLNMKGVIVPANWINGFVGKIPIIGMLAGGSDEGLVAFRYTVDGKYSDPQVSVNPLSGFTPGFLRNIFSIFDAPPPDELKDVQPEAYPSEKKKK
ncbi:MAG: AsmA-like C-terminal domain-containing protein [Alphaproteobacteria bacterium]|nr:AsmA-like C-terminal domain-containing protein [Alphaproteobacteria bacterium]